MDVRGPLRIALLLGLSLPESGFGAGLQTLEQGTSDIGRAMVGAASIADSATTAYWNPAGMTRLARPEIVGGLMYIEGEARFDPGPATTVPGGDGGNALDDALAPAGLFYAMPVGEAGAVGFSATAPFVGSLGYSKDWVGRYLVQEIDLATFAAGPAAAYRLTDRLSVGLQGGVVYGKVDLKAAVNTGGLPLPLPPGDGRVHVDSADQWAFAWGAGILWEPVDGTRIGLAYKSEVELDDLEGDLKLHVGPGFTGSLNTGFTLPQSLALSVTHELTEKLTVFGDYAWADFSEFDLVSVELSRGTGAQLKTGFKDAVAFGVGAAYDLTPEWTIQAGISYAGSPVSNSKRTPALPYDRQVRYGAGVIYRWTEHLDVALSYEYLDLGDARFNVTLGNGDVVAGDYDTNRAQFLALTVHKRF